MEGARERISIQIKRRGVPAVVIRRREEPRFEQIKTVYFTVPEDHDPHDITFEESSKKMGETYKPTVNFEAGRMMKLVLYRPHNGPRIQDCLNFIARKGGLLVGTEGLLLSWIEKGDDLPADMWLLSFDEEAKLPRDSGDNPRLLGIFKSSASMMGSERYLVRVDGPLSSKNCLMVFTYDDTGEGLE